MKRSDDVPEHRQFDIIITVKKAGRHGDVALRAERLMSEKTDPFLVK